jgi:hypothetical protein
VSRLTDILEKNFPKYDVTMKIMFVVKHSMLRKMLNVPTGQDMPQEFPDFEQSKIDAMVFAESKIYHIEFQSWNDPTMPKRMLDYRNSIGKWYKRVQRKTVSDVIQTVLYIGTPDILMKRELKGTGLDFSFALHDIREFGPDWGKKLKTSQRPLNWILALMCVREIPGDHIWRSVAEGIKTHVGPQAILPLPAILLVAATLRNVSLQLREEIVRMFSLNVQNDPLFKEVYVQGNERAAKKELLMLVEDGLDAREITLADEQRIAIVDLEIGELRQLAGMMTRMASKDKIIATLPKIEETKDNGMDF